MKIVLTTMPKEGSAVQWVTPKYFQPDTSKYIPLGLLSLATNLPQDNEITVLDPHSRNWTIDKTVDEIEKLDPDVLGMSVSTFGAYPMTKILKYTSVKYKVVGGPHATNNSKHIFNQGADAVIVGQLVDLEFSKAVYNQPKGIIFGKTGINDIKFPDRKFLDQDYYYSTGNLFKSNKRISMFSGVGCPFRCNFCDVQTKTISRKYVS